MSSTLSARGRWLALLVLAVPCALAAMDLSVLFLAVPQLSDSLKPNATELLWITDVYGFLVAGALILMGTLGDRIGRRRVLLTGGAAFAVASVLAAVAWSPEVLIAARAIQGVAGATLVPSTMALVFGLFPDETERTKALGLVIAGFAAGAALGPIIGGLVLEVFSWRGVFLINVPAMAALLVAGPRLLPEMRNPAAPPVDVLSAVLGAAGMLPVIFGLKRVAASGVDAAAILSMAGGLLVLWAFIARQHRLAAPLLDLDLLRRRVPRTGLIANVLIAGAMFGGFFFGSQYFQLSAGLTPLQAALLTLGPVLILMVAAGQAPKLATRVRPGVLLPAGLALAGGGFALMLVIGATNGAPVIVLGLAIIHIGISPGMALGTNLIVGAAPPERAGAASGLAQTANELGGALGIALLGSLGTAIYRSDADGLPGAAHSTLAGAVRMGDGLADGALRSARLAFVHGMHVGIGAAVVLMLLATVITAIGYRDVPSPAPAEVDVEVERELIPA